MLTGDNDYDTPIDTHHGNFVIRRHPDTMPARPGPLEAFDDRMSSDYLLARHGLGDPAHVGARLEHRELGVPQPLQRVQGAAHRKGFLRRHAGHRTQPRPASGHEGMADGIERRGAVARLA